jgi:DNA polymerase-3 subunit beta
MKIQTKSLRAALDSIRSIIQRRNTLPILSCVKLETQANGLHIEASNLDEHIVEVVEADGEMKPICVSFNQLDFALSGEVADLKLTKAGLIVTCGEDETQIATMDAEEFPPHPKMEKAQKHGVACDELAKYIKQVDWSASTDETRYVLQSVYIESDARKLSVIATNGRELAMAETTLIGSKFTILVPSNFSGNLSAMLARKSAVLSSSANGLRVDHDAGSYFCKQMDGNYPNYKQVIPDKMKPLGGVNVEAMKEMIAGCVAFDTRKSEAKAKFTFSKNELLVEFAGDNNAKLKRHLYGKFEPFVIALSLRKMQMIFGHIKTDEVKLFYVDEFTPLKIEAGEVFILSIR